MTYREYPKFFTVWANHGKVGLKLEAGGLSRTHDIQDCFERAFKSLEAKNPFDLKCLEGLPKPGKDAVSPDSLVKFLRGSNTYSKL